MSYQLGIDLGTTFTSVARAEHGSLEVVSLGQRQATPPAVVFVEKDGSFSHGGLAYRKGATEPDRLITDVKRRLGQSTPVIVDGTNYRAETLMTSHLQWAYDEAVADRDEAPTVVVITHPACWNDRQLAAFHRAVEMTTVPFVQYQTEPHAAAEFYRANASHDVGDVIGVYDLGGGTFDAAVLRDLDHGYELVGSPAGEPHLGGIDLDVTMQHLVQTKLGSQWLEAELEGGASFARSALAMNRECTAAKELLSEAESADVSVNLPSGTTNVTVTRREYEQYIQDAISESVGVFRRVLQSASVAPSDLSAVLMVGGSTAIPLVQSTVRGLVGPDVTMFTTDPRNAVAKGAALWARGSSDNAVPSTAAAVSTPAAVVVEPDVDLEAPAPAPAVASTAFVPSEGADSANKKFLIGAGALLAIGLLVGLFLQRGGDDPEVEEVAAATTVAAAVTVAPAESTDDDAAEVAVEGIVELPLPSDHEMVMVPAGSYGVGVEIATSESLSWRELSVEGFFIDTAEVTNASYVDFVQLEGAPAPVGWTSGSFPDGQDDFAVIGVEWAWADAYCNALGKRLPTEAEWEVAARGTEGAIFPWGNDELAIDFDKLGPAPVRSEVYNESSFGVFDTIGGVWEWVGEPIELTAEATQVVRRGGENGRVDETIGVAIRQIVQQSNQLAVEQTGFRCAATEVSSTTPSGTFINDLVAPRELAEAADSSPGGDAFVEDEFEDSNSGWFDVEADGWRIGYHAPTWYHVEATKPNSQVMSLGGYSYDNVAVETSVFIESTDTDNGLFRYGLVFRASGLIEAPPANGNGRPYEFYAFVINPRGGTWELLHEDELPYRALATGPLPEGVLGFDSTRPDTIRAEMVGVTISLSINGQAITSIDTRGFHPAGDVGFFVETFDETKVHAHYENMLITPLQG